MGVDFIIRKLPIFKNREAITTAVAKNSNIFSFESAHEASAKLDVPEHHRRSFDVKDVRLNALLEIGAGASDPMVDEFKQMNDTRWGMINDLEKKYGQELNDQIKVVISDAKDDDVDIHLVEQVEKPVAREEQ